MFACKNFCDSHAFVFGFVGQHWSYDGIADGVNASYVCGPMRVGFNLTALCEFHANLSQAQAICVGFATRCDQDNVCIKRML